MHTNLGLPANLADRVEPTTRSLRPSGVMLRKAQLCGSNPSRHRRKTSQSDRSPQLVHVQAFQSAPSCRNRLYRSYSTQSSASLSRACWLVVRRALPPKLQQGFKINKIGVQGRVAGTKSRAADVRFGSLADIARHIEDVCFTLTSGHAHQRHRRPLSAKTGHSEKEWAQQCSVLRTPCKFQHWGPDARRVTSASGAGPLSGRCK